MSEREQGDANRECEAAATRSTGRARGAIGEWSRRASHVLASVYCGIVVLSFLPLELAAGGVGRALASLVPGGDVPALAIVVGYPLALASSVVVRALATRRSADVVLAAFSTPVFFFGVLAVFRHPLRAGGVAWGSALFLVAGTVFAVLVVADGLLAMRIDDDRGIDG